MIPRLIPRLDIKGDRLVKGIQLEGIRPLGAPADFAAAYYEAGADELLFVDVVASLYGRNSLLGTIEATAREIFCPLAVGGGIRTLGDIRAVLRAGADKVCMNTAAIRRPQLVTEAARQFGASTIVVNVEAKRRGEGRWEAYTDSGRERTGRDAVEWAAEAAQRGAGELLLTSIDNEGTGRGLDIELIREVASRVSVPIIASGGVGQAAHVAAGLAAGAGAVAVASILHYERLGLEPVTLRRGSFEVTPPKDVYPLGLEALRAALGLPSHQAKECTRAG